MYQTPPSIKTSRLAWVLCFITWGIGSILAFGTTDSISGTAQKIAIAIVLAGFISALVVRIAQRRNPQVHNVNLPLMGMAMFSGFLLSALWNWLTDGLKLSDTFSMAVGVSLGGVLGRVIIIHVRQR